MILRDYQHRVISDFKSAMEDHKRIVVACPTGSGKTVLAVDGIMPLLPHPIAWVTHRRELAWQIKAKQSKADVIMSQARNVRSGYGSIVIDEAHHVCADQYRRIMAANKHAIIVALTATPYRMDGAGLGSCGFSTIIYGPDIYDLTIDGWLAPARVFIPKSETRSEWTGEAVAGKLKDYRFKQAVIYCSSVALANETSSACSDFGFQSATISSCTKRQDRDSIMDRFRSGEISVICNHTILTEGNDIPSVDMVVLNRRTDSRCLWRQMTGRGLRPCIGKDKCIILDLVGNGTVHGSIYDREIFSLHGDVVTTEPRDIPRQSAEKHEVQFSNGEELKEWKPQPVPVSIFESLQRLKSKSPWRRLRIGLSAC